ncbi:N-acetylmuramoyl-L-alanine amidase [Alkalicoccobacillus gibsonii]|uniref:N-acetylmuramoyl-L-alanine amidase n=1 Tax=Alkalicoccobacillus gibsonii TaxID=79881 RepID=UPI00193201FD|nr:N-acetylmuramoyl-L-alanine amidase [Alkalicoccobacillus gibsonii]MBM0064793.1 N-acetylmuramoyl-L-alanine amidase [Alkalicoccobacillus gibsonii]
MQIKQDLLPTSASNRPGNKITPTYITVHETANTRNGANAETHARYIKGADARNRQVSWHYTTDDKEIIQHLPDNERGWHAGSGNGSSIGIELCVNSDGDFQKTKRHAANLIQRLMKKHNIPLSRVVTHKHWTGKNCPARLLNEWDSFKQLVSGVTSVPNETKPATPAPTPASKPQPTTSNTAAKSGEGIVDYLNRVGIDSSMNNRKKLADQHGIKNYTGTAQQNTDLLNKIASGKAPATKPAPKKATTSSTPAKSGEGLVDYLNRVKINSSFGNREKLAAEHGIKGYKGTASQNTELLNKISGSSPKPTSKPAAKKSSNPKAKSGEGLVDYLKRIKVDSSFGNRQKLASQHGIRDYKGTAKQNSDLLNKISG